MPIVQMYLYPERKMIIYGMKETPSSELRRPRRASVPEDLEKVRSLTCGEALVFPYSIETARALIARTTEEIRISASSIPYLEEVFKTRIQLRAGYIPVLKLPARKKKPEPEVETKQPQEQRMPIGWEWGKVRGNTVEILPVYEKEK